MVGITLLKVIEQLLHKIKANRQREDVWLRKNEWRGAEEQWDSLLNINTAYDQYL